MTRFFVTICCHERKNLFRKTELATSTTAILKETCFSHCFRIYAYCFMPDHLHALLEGTQDSANLPQTIRAFKGAASAVARRSGVRRLWQKGFYDHVVRSGESMNRIAWYILMNPVRAKMAKRARDWQFSDSMIPNWKRLEEPSEVYEPLWKVAAEAKAGGVNPPLRVR